MYDQLKAAQLVFTIFASLLVSSVTIAAAIGPAHPAAAQFA
jgi:hypothetical protein